MTGTSIVAFLFGYGAVLSIIEDQSGALFLGAALGVLWRESIPVRAPPRWASIVGGGAAGGRVRPVAAATRAAGRIR